MRTMLRITIPVEKGNAAIQDGSLPKTVETVMNELKPECAYFFTDGGKRSALLVFDLAETSSIPPVVEPLFINLDAEISLTPVMNGDELAKGLTSLQT